MNSADGSESYETGFNAVLASFIIIGVILLWSGIHSVLNESADVGFSAYRTSKTILSAFLIPLSAICLHRGQSIACMVSLSVSMFMLTFIPSSFILESPMTDTADLPFAILFASMATVSFVKGGRAVAVGCALIAVSILMNEFDGSEQLGDIAQMMSGVLFLSIGVKGFIRVRAIPPSSVAGGWDDGMSSVPGIMLMGSLGLITAVSADGPTIYLDTAVLSLTMIVSSLGMMSRGRLVTGIPVMMYGMSNMVNMIPTAVGAGILEWGSCGYLIPVVVCGLILVRGNVVLGSTLAASGALGIIGIITGSQATEIVSGLIMGIGCISSSVMVMVGWMRFSDTVEVIPELAGSAQVPTAGGLALGCMMLMASFTGWFLSFEGQSYDRTADSMMFISALLVILMSAVSMRSRMITESIIMMLAGCSVMIFTVADIAYMGAGLGLMSAFMTLGLLVGASMLIRRRDYCRGSATILFIIAMIAVSAGFKDVAHVASLLSGLLYIASAVRRLFVFNTGQAPGSFHGGSLVLANDDYPVMLTKTMGTFIIAILTLMYGLSVIGPDQYQGMDVTRVILCLVLMGFGIYAVYNGIGTSGSFMFMTSMFGLVSSAANIAGLSIPGTMQQLVAFSFIPVFVSAFRGGDRIFFLISSLMAVSFFIGPVTEADDIFTIVDMALKVITCISALIVWVQYDTGCKFMDGLLARLTRKGRVRKAVVTDSMITVRSMSFMQASLLCIWAGLSLLSGSVSDPGHMIPFIALSSTSIMFSLCMMSKGMFVEGLCIFSIAVMGMSMPFPDRSLDLATAFLIVYSSVVAIMGGRRSMAIVTLLCLGGFIVSFLCSDALGGAGVLFAGAVMYIQSVRGFVGMDIRPSVGGDIVSISMTMVAASSMMTFLSFAGPDLYISGFIISLVASTLSLVVMMSGREIECLYMLSASVPCMSYGILGMAGVISDSAPLMVMVMSLSVAGYVFMIRHEAMQASACAVMMLSSVVFILTEDIAICALGGLLFSILTFISTMNVRKGGTAKPSM